MWPPLPEGSQLGLKKCVSDSVECSPQEGTRKKRVPELASQEVTPAAWSPLGSGSSCFLKMDGSIVSTGSGPGEPNVGGKLGELWTCGHHPPSLASVPVRWGCAVPTSSSGETAGE